jgi:hypothetical protein
VPLARTFSYCQPEWPSLRLHICVALCQGQPPGRGQDMLRWLRRRRERVERIEVEAEELIRLLGGDACSEARWREQTASSSAMAQEWNLIARAIARQTGRRIGLAPDELKRILAAKPQPFRIQFVGAAPDRGLSILGEVEVQALDVSAAIVAAANLAFPPKTVAAHPRP